MDLNLTTEELSFRDELRVWLVSQCPKDWNEWREKPIEESFPYPTRLATKAPRGPLGSGFHGRENKEVAAPR